MKHIFLIIVACILTVSCNLQKSSVTTDEITAARKLAESGEYINVDLNKLSDELSSVDTKASTALKNDKDKAYAALYRFYSHVQLVDSSYVCSLKSAEEINVAPSVFETLKGNLDDMNRQIRALRQSGEKVSLPEIDDDYLRSLLR